MLLLPTLCIFCDLMLVFLNNFTAMLKIERHVYITLTIMMKLQLIALNLCFSAVLCLRPNSPHHAKKCYFWRIFFIFSFFSRFLGFSVQRSPGTKLRLILYTKFFVTSLFLSGRLYTVSQ